MSKLYQQLENLFKYRVNSNGEIIPYIKKLAEAGKLDEPKKVAVLAIILDRLGKMEDDAAIAESVKTIDTEPIAETPPVAAVEPEPEVTQPEIPVQTEATPPQDAPTPPDGTEAVQIPPVEMTPEETPTPPAAEIPADVPDTTVSEFSLDAIAEKPATPSEETPTPPIENAE